MYIREKDSNVLQYAQVSSSFPIQSASYRYSQKTNKPLLLLDAPATDDAGASHQL
jgi:hypothetical protein